ncbi:hypothetical protein QBC37DRAFT_425555 [Rhypophila decipiens]|uniref:Uncharacterized protein n=1 Tax=Rhypophila decipiens TaxID=261697 RepID=A0AAN6Y3V9_9PEZI|nr:hypothetical protein QBC37DRAFT_425555 [Rhypophila decipiens]
MISPIATITAVLGLLASATIAAPNAAPAAEPGTTLNVRDRWLGNIDMNAACEFQYGGGTKAYTIGNGCNDWRCDGDRGINVNVYCYNHFGSDAWATCGGGTVWDWQCHGP